jgi:hypothetical protein
MAKEIYRIKFGKFKTEQGIPAYTMYTLGGTGLVDGEMLTPQKIIVKGDKIIVRFAELGIQHIFAYDPKDVELFYREKQKKNANQTEN